MQEQLARSGFRGYVATPLPMQMSASSLLFRWLPSIVLAVLTYLLVGTATMADLLTWTKPLPALAVGALGGIAMALASRYLVGKFLESQDREATLLLEARRPVGLLIQNPVERVRPNQVRQEVDDSGSQSDPT
ncbi:MAG: hypothetical protein ACYDBQ_05890 [Thermoplasmatota archaeon]